MANTFKHSQNRSGKAFMTALVAVLMAAVLLFIGGVLGFFAHKDAWFGKDETVQAEEDDLLGAGGMTMPEKVESGYLALMSVSIPSAQFTAASVPDGAESAVTVKATLYDYEHVELDETALGHVKLNWTLKWKSNSGFAIDKDVNEYVSVAAAQDTFSATVSCLQPFGQQIVLEVGVEGDPSVTASVSVDYMQRYDHWKATVHMVSSLMPQLQGSAYTDTATAEFDSVTNQYVRYVVVDFPANDITGEPVTWTNTNNSIDFTVVGSDIYTLPLTYTVGGLKVKCVYANEITAAGGTPYTEYQTPIDPGYDEATHSYQHVKFHDLLGMSFSNEGVFSVNKYRSAMGKFQLSTASALVNYKFTDVKINGEPVEENFEFGIGFSLDSLYVSPEEMELDQSGIVY